MKTYTTEDLVRLDEAVRSDGKISGGPDKTSTIVLSNGEEVPIGHRSYGWAVRYGKYEKLLGRSYAKQADLKTALEDLIKKTDAIKIPVRARKRPNGDWVIESVGDYSRNWGIVKKSLDAAKREAEKRGAEVTEVVGDEVRADAKEYKVGDRVIVPTKDGSQTGTVMQVNGDRYEVEVKDYQGWFEFRGHQMQKVR